jgi:hypothetical protein
MPGRLPLCSKDSFHQLLKAFQKCSGLRSAASPAAPLLLPGEALLHILTGLLSSWLILRSPRRNYEKFRTLSAAHACISQRMTNQPS